MMNFLSKLMSWASIFSKENLERFDPTGDARPSDWVSYATKFEWIGRVFQPISIILYVMLGLVGAAGAIYAIYLGIQLARAEDQSKRDDAKKHLITVLIALAVTVVLILFFNEIMPLIVEAFLLPAKA